MVAGPVQEYSPALKNFWYPVVFTDDMKEDTMVTFECFEEPWVLFRGQDGKVGCVRNSCAHRACPLHLRQVIDGRIQCPYYGWEYVTNGVCEKVPSTKLIKVSIEALPCVEKDGMVWIWPRDGIPDGNLPSLAAPAGYTTHAQIVIEIPVEHGLLMENLLDLAHAPFTHTNTFAKGWPVPREAGEKQYARMCQASPSAACLFSILSWQNSAALPPLFGFFLLSEACSIHRVSVEASSQQGKGLHRAFHGSTYVWTLLNNAGLSHEHWHHLSCCW